MSTQFETTRKPVATRTAIPHPCTMLHHGQPDAPDACCRLSAHPVQEPPRPLDMSFLSMLGMEAAANATNYLLTDGEVHLHEPLYWTALGLSLLAGFLFPFPYNYRKFKNHGRACH